MKQMNVKQLKVLIAAFCMVFCYGIVNNTVSFYLIPVTEAFGIGRAQYNLVNTVIFLVTAFTAPIFGQILQKFNMRMILCVGLVAGVACMLGYSLAPSIFVFYIIAAVLGLFQSGATMAAAGLALSQAYGNRMSVPMGIAMAATGTCSMIMGQILPRFIESSGWAAGYRLQAILWAVFMLIAIVLIGDPSTAMSEEERKLQAQQAGSAQSTELKGASVTQALRSPQLYLFMAGLVIMDLGTMFLQHMFAFAQEKGLDLIAAGNMFTFYSLVAIFAKIALGSVFQKLGPVKATVVAYVSFAVGMYIMNIGSFAAMCVGAIPLALGMSVALVATPLQTRAIFGDKNFAAIGGWTTMAASLGTSVGSPVWGFVYDMTGSYNAMILAIPVIMILNGLFIAFIIKRTPNWEEKQEKQSV